METTRCKPTAASPSFMLQAGVGPWAGIRDNSPEPVRPTPSPHRDCPWNVASPLLHRVWVVSSNDLHVG
eukprot:7067898-Pyramimonas_sp.AAC.1